MTRQRKQGIEIGTDYRNCVLPFLDEGWMTSGAVTDKVAETVKGQQFEIILINPSTKQETPIRNEPASRCLHQAAKKLFRSGTLIKDENEPSRVTREYGTDRYTKEGEYAKQ